MGDVSHSLALLHFRYGRLGLYFTLRALCLYVLSILSSFLGVSRLPLLHPVNREAVIRTHFMHTFLCYFYAFYIFPSHTPPSFERESRQKRFSYSATREAAKWSHVKTVLDL